MFGVRRDSPLRMCTLILPVLLLAGCGGRGGPERAAVHGKVTFDNQPVQEGIIAFIPTDGGPSSGGKIENGTFDIPAESGPSLGPQRVEIRAFRTTGKQSTSKIRGETTGPSGTPTTAEAMKQYIPAAYNTKSTLKFEIESGKNEKDFDLKSTP
jgi:hypothetical protein